MPKRVQAVERTGNTKLFMLPMQWTEGMDPCDGDAYQRRAAICGPGCLVSRHELALAVIGEVVSTITPKGNSLRGTSKLLHELFLRAKQKDGETQTEGFEPSTAGSVDRCSIQLSYVC